MLTNWILVSMIAALGAPETPSSTTWASDYGTALEQCREAQKPLLVVLDKPATPGQSLDTQWLEEKQLASYELCHVDVTTEYGQRVAEVFGVKSFPHVAIIDRSGSVILSRLRGDISHDAWQTALERHENGLRRSTVEHHVSKPVVESSYSPVVTPSSSNYVVPSQVYSQPYCPSCQLRN